MLLTLCSCGHVLTVDAPGYMEDAHLVVPDLDGSGTCDEIDPFKAIEGTTLKVNSRYFFVFENFKP